MTFDQANYILLGKVTKPHGIKGQIKVYPFSEIPENFKFYPSLVLVHPVKKDAQELKVSHNLSQGKIAILSLAGVTSRNDAEELVGCEVWVAKEDLPELADGEYYWNDFQGMEVYTIKGDDLGHVSSLMSTGAHDILVIAGRGTEFMIPLREEFIVEINKADNKIIVDPPEGLLEINTKGK